MAFAAARARRTRWAWAAAWSRGRRRWDWADMVWVRRAGGVDGAGPGLPEQAKAGGCRRDVRLRTGLDHEQSVRSVVRVSSSSAPACTAPTI
jgi:hypothetical protein